MGLVLTEAQAMVRASVRQLVERRIARRAVEIDVTGEFPWDNIQHIAELGLFGIALPEEYGGQGGDLLTYAVVSEELARGCRTTSAIKHVNWATAMLILSAGNEAQKRTWVPPLAQGAMGAIAWTEPDAGSDRANVRTRAVPDGSGWVINGSKCFISNVGVASIYVVVARTSGNHGLDGLSTFLVAPDTPGFRIARMHDKMGARAYPVGELVFEDCRVDGEALLGEEGQGYHYLHRLAQPLRPGLAAQGVGLAQAALELATQYAGQRVQFGQTIGRFQAIETLLAEMAVEVHAARLMTYHAAVLADQGQPSLKEAAMAKAYAGEMANRVVYKATQVFGGWGYMKEMPIERLYRDARVLTVAEGTTQIQNSTIARELLGGNVGP